MTLTELLLIRGGWTPAELRLPDDVHDPAAPRGVPAKGKIGNTWGPGGQFSSCNGANEYYRLKARRKAQAERQAEAQRARPRPTQTDGQAEAQRASERDMVRAAERERDARRMRELDAAIAAEGGW
jgi:hypothetical protein